MVYFDGWHFAVEPGKALCNANQPNQKLTEVVDTVNCNKCKKKLAQHLRANAIKVL